VETAAAALKLNLPSIQVKPVEPGEYFKQNPVWMAAEFETFIRATKGIDYYRPFVIFEKQSPAPFKFGDLAKLLSPKDLFSEERVAAIAAGLLEAQPPRARGMLSTHASNLLCTERYVIDISLEMVSWRLRFFDRKAGFFDRIAYGPEAKIFSPNGF